MKLSPLLAILCISPFSLVAQSDDAQVEKPTGAITQSSVIDTGWVDSNPIEECPETHFPTIIELMPLPGDGVRFKSIFIPKPSKGFEYKYVVLESTPKYHALHSEYTKQGYIQICHQIVTVMIGNVHQAVWVKSDKREQDDVVQSATAVDSM